MKYPDHETYRRLYGRYLKKGPERFFAKAGDLAGKHVLDLCSGGGQLAQYAIDNGAMAVVMVDLATQMLSPNFRAESAAIRIETSVEAYIHGFTGSPFDLVVCRQGVNYWFLNVNPELLAKMIKPGGMFVFNTFGNKPTEEPMVKEYFHGNRKFREVSFMFEGRIHHVQCCERMEPHFTVFDWIDREVYLNWLSPFFTMEEDIDGPSSMWYCTRK